MKKSAKKPIIVMLLGGLDPMGDAGLLADAAMLQLMGVPYVAIATAFTTQRSGEFLNYHPTDYQILKEQIDFYLKHYQISVIKIGMLARVKNIDLIISLIKRSRAKWVIWDPIFKASAGKKLVDQQKFSGKFCDLLAQVNLVTPNLPELDWMQGADLKKIAVLIKGGHAVDKIYANDYLHYRNKIKKFSSKRLVGKFRGTGCRLASLIAAYLYLGKDLPDAIGNAKKQLQKLLAD